jgi:peptide-methionine (S)-S-oxide reductase
MRRAYRLKELKMKTEKAIFSAGCFWHVQHDFDCIKGVVRTTAGYIGGDEKKYPAPKYEMLHSGKTGYAEAVEVIFNPQAVSYRELLDSFWKMHNPATENRQGLDFGAQYRAAVFYLSESQRKLSEESKKRAEEMLAPKKVYTAIEKAGKFFPAEPYHQKYLEKRGESSCKV